MPIERERKINNDQLADQMKNGSYQPKYHITFLNIEERKKKKTFSIIVIVYSFFFSSLEWNSLNGTGEREVKLFDPLP